MKYLEEVKIILSDTLNVANMRQSLHAESPLLGNIPELDSMAVISLIAALEDHFGICMADDEINGATFATLGSLAEFIGQKMAA